MIDYPDSTGVAVRDRLLFDLFLCAVPLGIIHWAHGYYRAVDKYHFSATIVDYDLRTHRIDRTTMLHGLTTAAYTWRHQVTWSTELPPTLFEQDAEWTFNDRDADYVVQLGLFHDLPYSTENLIRRGIIHNPRILQDS